MSHYITWSGLSFAWLIFWGNAESIARRGEEGGGGETSRQHCFVNDVFHYAVLIVSIKQGRAMAGRFVWVIWLSGVWWCNECDECLYWLSEDQTGLREGLGQGSRVCPDMRISHQESYTITITNQTGYCHTKADEHWDLTHEVNYKRSL